MAQVNTRLRSANFNIEVEKNNLGYVVSGNLNPSGVGVDLADADAETKVKALIADEVANAKAKFAETVTNAEALLDTQVAQLELDAVAMIE